MGCDGMTSGARQPQLGRCVLTAGSPFFGTCQVLPRRCHVHLHLSQCNGMTWWQPAQIYIKKHAAGDCSWEVWQVRQCSTSVARPCYKPPKLKSSQRSAETSWNERWKPREKDVRSEDKDKWLHDLKSFKEFQEIMTILAATSTHTLSAVHTFERPPDMVSAVRSRCCVPTGMVCQNPQVILLF